ncbi:UNVERIFIED_CONTAM: Signal peptidase complex catalytic subunit SEC11C [Sesamum angustifolium]|uniref:signal peptidase I n=1 Tax=Sesamum angustifolium TaxID=2727405 RepID=A0AAW2LJE8_9LAMI
MILKLKEEYYVKDSYLVHNPLVDEKKNRSLTKIEPDVDACSCINIFCVLIEGMIVASALMIWKTLMCVTGSESPVVVVLSESMEPGFSRGDILFLYLSRDPIRVGEIVVYNIDGRDIPIVHRVIKVHERKDTGEVDILTKGDNNEGDDIPLYAPDQYWLQRHHIMGRAVGFLPYVGWATIIMTEKPIIKYVLISVLGLLAITSND